MSLNHEKLNIPGYEIIEKIGEGGMANVYMARQTRLDRIIAIKVLKYGLSDDKNEDSENRDRFKMEAQAAARINHPNLVQIIDFGEHEGHTYIIMEHVPGCTIGDLLQLRHAINEKDGYAICSELANALDHCWNQHRMIHCDIKPDNVIVHTDGTIKLADLGLARVKGFRQIQSQEDFVMGTPNYFSPEQALDEVEIDCRADIYSLGAMLYQMLTGIVPFDGDDPEAVAQKQLDAQLTDPWEINHTIPPAFAWLLEKMMAKDRDLRQRDWKEVAEDLETAMRGCLIDKPIDDPSASTIARNPDRPKPEKLKRKKKPGPARKSVASADTPERAKRKVLISDADKRKIDRQHYQQLRDDTPRAMFLLGASAVLAVVLYGWSVLHSGNAPAQLQAAILPPPLPSAPALEDATIAPLDRIEHNSIEEQENMAAIREEIAQKLRRPGPPPPKPKPRNGAAAPTGPQSIMETGPIDLRKRTPVAGSPTQEITGGQPDRLDVPPPTKPENYNGNPATWDSPAYKAARLKIIDNRKAFYFYVQNRGDKGRLKKIEADVREAIAELKKVQAVAPDGTNIDHHITAGYKLISDCHAATQL